METIILIITPAAMLILFFGFTGARLPMIPAPLYRSRKISRHMRKMLRKRSWYRQIHPGFIKLPADPLPFK